MSRLATRILRDFTPDLARVWIVCDPDDVLLDEEILSALRGIGFGILRLEDPFAFRAEYEEEYRSAWDAGDPAPTRSLIVHHMEAEPRDIPWDVARNARVVRLGLADLFPRLAPSAVRLLPPGLRAALYDAHEDELQTARGENESKDFILQHVYRITPSSIRSPADLWRDLMRMHFAGLAPPLPLAKRAADIIQARGIHPGMPMADWFASRADFLQAVGRSWRRHLASLGIDASGSGPRDLDAPEIPFGHSDVQTIVDSMFMNGSLRPAKAASIPGGIPAWIMAGIEPDPESAAKALASAIRALADAPPGQSALHREWGEYAMRYGDARARLARLRAPWPADAAAAMSELESAADASLLAWISSGRYADLMLQPAASSPPMVHHIPRLLRKRMGPSGKTALVVMDGLALDQWSLIRDRLDADGKRFAFDEGATFAWLPTVTSVSRQAIFSGLRPRDFAASIDRTDREESLWKTFWQNEGIAPSQTLYRKSLRETGQLDALEEDIKARRPRAVGLVVDEVDARMHAESSKAAVARNLDAWLDTGFLPRLFGFLLDEGYDVHVTSDHGNADASGAGRPKDGDIPESRGERSRVYRSAPLLAAARLSSPQSPNLEPPGLPDSFMVLFAPGRSAFVPQGERLVAHGGPSIEELLVPFVKVSRNA